MSKPNWEPDLISQVSRLIAGFMAYLRNSELRGSKYRQRES